MGVSKGGGIGHLFFVFRQRRAHHSLAQDLESSGFQQGGLDLAGKGPGLSFAEHRRGHIHESHQHPRCRHPDPIPLLNLLSLLKKDALCQRKLLLDLDHPHDPHVAIHAAQDLTSDGMLKGLPFPKHLHFHPDISPSIGRDIEDKSAVREDGDHGSPEGFKDLSHLAGSLICRAAHRGRGSCVSSDTQQPEQQHGDRQLDRGRLHRNSCVVRST